MLLLANLGAGALVSWLALPLFAQLTRLRFVNDPASSHRALLWALVLASSLVLVPWLRDFIPWDDPLAHPAVAVAADTGSLSAPAVAAPQPTLPPVWGFYVLGTVGAAWSLAAALSCALACVSFIQLRLLVARSRGAPREVQETIAAGGVARGARWMVRGMLSDEASVPFAAIPWSPVVVLPSSFVRAFDRAALQLVVEHELAHLERGDLWTSAVVRALCILFPGHPTAKRLAEDIAFAREAAVDARVAARDPHRYATLLVEVASHARFDQLPRPVSMDETALTRRIAMITDAPAQRKLSLTPLVATAAVILVGGLFAPKVLAMPASPTPGGRAGAAFIVGPVPAESGPESKPPHYEDIRACYDEAAKTDPGLVVDTQVTLVIDVSNGRVVSASAPTPSSPAFQKCVEREALGWTFPLPPGPPPSKDARVTVGTHVRFPE
jgi:beta-lactamase regulating signal transducer with metallopeptidase domain